MVFMGLGEQMAAQLTSDLFIHKVIRVGCGAGSKIRLLRPLSESTLPLNRIPNIGAYLLNVYNGVATRPSLERPPIETTNVAVVVALAGSRIRKVINAPLLN